jgi:hypothetical protein
VKDDQIDAGSGASEMLVKHGQLSGGGGMLTRVHTPPLGPIFRRPARF